MNRPFNISKNHYSVTFTNFLIKLNKWNRSSFTGKELSN